VEFLKTPTNYIMDAQEPGTPWMYSPHPNPTFMFFAQGAGTVTLADGREAKVATGIPFHVVEGQLGKYIPDMTLGWSFKPVRLGDQWLWEPQVGQGQVKAHIDPDTQTEENG
jgi:hypothetical protein